MSTAEDAAVFFGNADRVVDCNMYTWYRENGHALPAQNVPSFFE